MSWTIPCTPSTNFLLITLSILNWNSHIIIVSTKNNWKTLFRVWGRTHFHIFQHFTPGTNHIIRVLYIHQRKCTISRKMNIVCAIIISISLKSIIWRPEISASFIPRWNYDTPEPFFWKREREREWKWAFCLVLFTALCIF